MNEYHVIFSNGEGWVYADSYKLEGSTAVFYRGKKQVFISHSVVSVDKTNA